VIDQLRKTGKVTRGRIGVSIANVTRDLADSLGLPRTDGAAVGAVEEDSPAAKAGVEVGDVILKIDGRTVQGSADPSRPPIGRRNPTDRCAPASFNPRSRPCPSNSPIRPC